MRRDGVREKVKEEREGWRGEGKRGEVGAGRERREEGGKCVCVGEKKMEGAEER